jgi:hypothetical protein
VRGRAALVGLAVVVHTTASPVDAACATASSAIAGQSEARAGAFAAAVTDDADVVLFPAARRPGARPTVTVAARVHAPPSAVGAVLLSPERYRAALPALIRAEVVGTRPGSESRFGPERLVAWELEIPLFNLKGSAWLSRRSDVIELTLVEGAFAPGRVQFQLTAEPGGQTTLFTSQVQLEARASNWLLRRVARHDPWAETAMTAAIGWTLSRAVALLAEVPGRAVGNANPNATEAELAGSEAPRPRGPMVPPEPTALDGAALAGPAWARLRALGPVAAVRRASTGRLAWVSTAVAMAGEAAAVSTRLATPETWAAFPGWGRVRRLAPAEGASGAGPGETLVAVKDNVPFVDLDATWRVSGPPLVRATAVAGATRGAAFRWQTFAPPPSRTTVSVFSLHPRLDTAGFIEKRMVAAEPLLEHALALALTYADAAAIADQPDAPARSESPR